jgi:hypothetical protein
MTKEFESIDLCLFLELKPIDDIPLEWSPYFRWHLNRTISIFRNVYEERSLEETLVWKDKDPTLKG